MSSLDEVKRQIDRGFAGLDERQDAQDQKINETKEWLTEVEAKVNTSRFGGTGRQGSDRLLAAIPDFHRKQIEIAERGGAPDPIGKAAMASWLSCRVLERMGPIMQTPLRPEHYREAADNIEKGWGYDPAQRTHLQKAALAEGAAGTGGAIIATPVEAELLRLISDNTIIRPLATKIVMTSLTHQIPVENQNVIAYIHTEATTITDSMPSTPFAQKPLTAKGFVGLATASNQVIQDNIIGLQEYVFTAVAERIGILEDIHALEGGFPTTTNFSGIALAAGVNSFTIGSTTVTGGNYPTYSELVQLVYTGAQQATRKGAGFFMLPQVFRGIVSAVDTTGQPLFTFSNIPNAIPSFIGGYPVYLVSSLSTQWTQGSNGSSSSNIYYGPPSKIIFGDLTGMLLDVDPYGLFDKVQTRLRIFKRTAIQVPVGGYFTFARAARSV